MKRSQLRRPNPADDRLTIAFDGPHTLCSESQDVLADCPQRKAPGIFLIAVLVGDSYRVTHLGQTGTSFYQRLREHVIQTLGGNFRICDPDALSQGETRVFWNGLWRTGTHTKLPEFLRDGPRLFEAARSCFKLEQVFIAPLTAQERTRKRIEGAIAGAIRKHPEASSLFPSDVRCLGRLTTETPIPIRIVTSCRILGLPEELDI